MTPGFNKTNHFSVSVASTPADPVLSLQYFGSKVTPQPRTEHRKNKVAAPSSLLRSSLWVGGDELKIYGERLSKANLEQAADHDEYRKKYTSLDVGQRTLFQYDTSKTLKKSASIFFRGASDRFLSKKLSELLQKLTLVINQVEEGATSL